MRERVAKRLGGTPRQHTRLMLAVWSLMHGTAMLIIRGGFEGVLRAQTVHACMDAFDGILDSAARSKGLASVRTEVAFESDSGRGQDRAESGMAMQKREGKIQSQETAQP